MIKHRRYERTDAEYLENYENYKEILKIHDRNRAPTKLEFKRLSDQSSFRIWACFPNFRMRPLSSFITLPIWD